MTTIHDKIVRRIRGKRKGWVFGPKDFLDIGARTAVDKTLSRLVQNKTIRRLSKGVYDYPKYSDLLGSYLTPSTDDIARVVAAKSGDKIFPSGAMAANLLGFSKQVPAKPAYLTNGVSRIKKINNRDIVLKHARVPIIDNISFTANLALQALSYMGKDNIDDDIIQLCARKLTKKDISSLNLASPLVPSWMVNTIFKIQSSVNG